ncbi:damage-control phosphatase ARMT1-like [Brevipalpus obovatus]|uniref:damage-control phosphatase ARMT1-like n=1 Tax=Brevipalpus obovatus TaxID=246614 RepID=UPI003D9DF082
MLKIPQPVYKGDRSLLAFKGMSERLPGTTPKSSEMFQINFAKFVAEKYKHCESSAKNAEREAKTLLDQFRKLRDDMLADTKLVPLIGEEEDVKIYNDVLNEWSAKLNGNPTYFSVPWLYAECYMYRKMREIFSRSQFLRDFDPFREQKYRALINSFPGPISLAKFLKNYQVSPEENSFDANLTQMIEINLWGNRCDLALKLGHDNVQNTLQFDELENLRPNILVNDCDKLVSKLKSLKSQPKATLDIVLDNAGYELFTDFCLVEFLHITGILPVESSRVRFYVKDIPWFVSDALVYDFQWTIKFLEETAESDLLQSLGRKWRGYLDQGIWTIENDLFFTLPHDFSQMKAIRPELYQKLSGADLILFKGDLNYRKLIGDFKWSPTTSFQDTLRGFNPSDLCTLRTIKSEVCIGFSSGKQLELLPEDWKKSSDYAVIQYSAK